MKKKRKKKKDILFLCQFFYPEYNSSATLPFDTARYLAAHGYRVDAMCGYPKEYSLKNNIPLTETKDNVNIKRLHYLQLARRSKIGRLINYFSFTAAILIRCPVLRKYESVIVYSNPPVLPIVPVFANIFFRTKFIFVAYDIYPEVAYASKTLSPNGTIAAVMRKINRQLYKRASKVVVLTDEMKRFILKNRPEIDEARIETIANWAHEKRREANLEAYEKFGYSGGQFIVSYFGNMGVCQDVDTMLGAIDILKDHPEIQFLIAGHGSKKEIVKEKLRGNKNVKVADFLLGEDFENALAISSCCIVSLENGLKGTCAPSKYYSYLQSGHPVLAVVEKDSYLKEEIIRKKIGYAVQIGEEKALADAILQLYKKNGECCRMGKRALALYEKEYEMSVALNKYFEMFSQVLEK